MKHARLTVYAAALTAVGVLTACGPEDADSAGAPSASPTAAKKVNSEGAPASTSAGSPDTDEGPGSSDELLGPSSSSRLWAARRGS